MPVLRVAETLVPLGAYIECRNRAMTASSSPNNHCPYLPSSETTAKGTGLEKLAGKEDPVELDSSLAL